MRKIIVIEFVTLDGVMQAPGGSKEDTAEGFKYGGWMMPFSDETFGEVMEKQMKPADYLLGRKPSRYSRLTGHRMRVAGPA